MGLAYKEVVGRTPIDRLLARNDMFRPKRKRTGRGMTVAAIGGDPGAGNELEGLLRAVEISEDPFHALCGLREFL
jgi:hypothetical protein